MIRTLATAALTAALTVGGMWATAPLPPTAVAEPPTVAVQPVTACGAPPVPATAGGKPNLNALSADQLDALPVKGLGAAWSRHIVEYRTAHGPFKAPGDVHLVPGLPDAVADAVATQVEAI